MLLAGGEGKRLGMLTKQGAKPAVPFGGKYRIIDFTLSNCTNSGIQTVGILTQYAPLELNKHIGNGKPWDMNHQHGGVSILPPYTGTKGGDWYSGTADAIYQNMNFIHQYEPEYVLIISGDHIYQMDYQQMLEQHKRTNADVTISVIEVPWAEAGRFGILHANDEQIIYEFEEKPKNPSSNLASMGIYIFNWKTLKKYLIEDANKPNSSRDFGKDIIPSMLNNKHRLYAFKFNGYWKDVGTIQSYWEANMDVLKDNNGYFSLHDRNWRIYTHDSNLPPHFIGTNGKVVNCYINSGSIIYGHIENSIVFRNVSVQEGSYINQSIIHPNVRIGKDCVLDRVIVMENTTIPEGTIFRSDKEIEPFIINNEILNSMLAPAGGDV
ncbi:glucose-1-phosphate adenylyltransferase [Oceanobacillus iheyensis]|uniref:glucose-1-phosphate adenylyltransferase n=1 Tax=Oceanobacillus iheyensis TaxID=182710 RepID=UPI00363FCA7C